MPVVLNHLSQASLGPVHFFHTLLQRTQIRTGCTMPQVSHEEVVPASETASGARQIVRQNYQEEDFFAVICCWRLTQDNYSRSGQPIASSERNFSKTTKFWSLAVLATGSTHGKEPYWVLYPRLRVIVLPPTWCVWSNSKHPALFFHISTKHVMFLSKCIVHFVWLHSPTSSRFIFSLYFNFAFTFITLGPWLKKQCSQFHGTSANASTFLSSYVRWCSRVFLMLVAASSNFPVV